MFQAPESAVEVTKKDIFLVVAAQMIITKSNTQQVTIWMNLTPQSVLPFVSANRVCLVSTIVH